VIIHKVVVENFAQFLGWQKILFGTPLAKPITLIIGENASGSTNFLNAVKWGLSYSLD